MDTTLKVVLDGGVDCSAIFVKSNIYTRKQSLEELCYFNFQVFLAIENLPGPNAISGRTVV